MIQGTRTIWKWLNLLNQLFYVLRHETENSRFCWEEIAFFSSLIEDSCDTPSFAIQDTSNVSNQCEFNGRPIISCEYRSIDRCKSHIYNLQEVSQISDEGIQKDVFTHLNIIIKVTASNPRLPQIALNLDCLTLSVFFSVTGSDAGCSALGSLSTASFPSLACCGVAWAVGWSAIWGDWVILRHWIFQFIEGKREKELGVRKRTVRWEMEDHICFATRVGAR